MRGIREQGTGRLSRWSPLIRFALLGAAVAGLAVAVAAGVLPGPAAWAELAANSGWTGPVWAVAGSALLVSALVPRSVLAAASGLLFGPLAGTGYVLAGAMIGGTVAFVAGRWLGRDFIVAGRRVAAVDRWIVARGMVAVATVRLLPVAPFGLISYGYGVTGIRLRVFLLGTAAGAAPSTAVYASLGASALSPGSPGFVVALLAALAMAVGGTVAARVLARHSPATQSP